MAIYTSNTNRVTGLSGMDTESMIDQLMKAESAKYEKLQKEQTKTNWKQEAYGELITKMQEFKEKWFGLNKDNNLGYNKAWNNFVTSVKDNTGNNSSAITIKNSINEGKYDIEVSQIAQTESLTGKPTIKTDLTTGKTADEIAKSINDLGELNLKMNLDGTIKEIKITKADLGSANGTNNAEKLENLFNEKLKKEFGVTTSGNNKVKVEKQADGKLKFSVHSGSALAIGEGTDVSKDVSLTQTDVLKSGTSGKYTLTLKIEGKDYKVEADFDTNDSADKRIAKIIDSFKKVTDSNGTEVDISKKVSISLDKDGDNLKITNNSYEKSLEIVNGSFNGSTFAGKTLNSKGNLIHFGFEGVVESKITKDSKLTQVFGDAFTKYLEDPANQNADGVVILNFGGKDITVTKEDTIDSLSKKISDSESGFKLSFNEVTGRFKVESTQSGLNGAINIDKNNNAAIKSADFILKFAGIDLIDKNNNDVVVNGQDAEFTIDGIQATRPSNEVDLNGLQFTINSVTNGKVTIESKGDQDATLKKLKDFVEDYNKLVEDIQSKIKEKREKSGKYGYYEPLTDDERKAMSEDEVKKWEEKAKQGLLYGDSLLSSMLSSLRSMVYEDIDLGGGRKISLYAIGITTTKDASSNKLEIDEDKLKKAIETRGDDIAKMFTMNDGIASKISKVFDNALSTSLTTNGQPKGYLAREAGIKGTTSVLNNNLSKEIESIQKRIKEEREKLYNKEMKYFEMFSKMESIMNQQNNQMATMLSLLGQM